MKFNGVLILTALWSCSVVGGVSNKQHSNLALNGTPAKLLQSSPGKIRKLENFNPEEDSPDFQADITNIEDSGDGTINHVHVTGSPSAAPGGPEVMSVPSVSDVGTRNISLLVTIAIGFLGVSLS
eukprot:CAMPEP_0198249154 /NCGR_PEP_ID=MMETSP1447-20131203/751_1 /TAXON_ID=420782 /ORGANISM="Chaetoceros dichaeta, Strain CCMP1751" /LENGTH=124 /DNA_ID=CAMNT_0043933713 /DNA_START=52 /DNA_END=426 /DNA_ORIENTATION=+